MLQERLYLVDHRGPIWRVRLSPLDRPMSTHDSEETALDAAQVVGRRWAPARIRVIHSGQVVTEWYIRYPDEQWSRTEMPRTGDLPKGSGYSETAPETGS
ncbi:MAG: hypothetical protein HKO53_10550 [Gemmatimonadetes bacterium]|nr:hypothetical protein [Gemmatimonadota bacterium]NNF27994.1 hypothetical protein [Gemmatimonadota bacterium]NNM33497.1 hypothetical protein [Gemmatimonadota bacterium]